MRTIFFSLVFLCIATCLSAQSISDSLRLEIISIVPDKYNNYDVNISIENRTKEFRYVLYYRPLASRNNPDPCWSVRFEVEYKDGTRDTCQAAGAFFDPVGGFSLLMPEERRTHAMPLFFNGMHDIDAAIYSDATHSLSDVKRIRFLNGTAIIRELNTKNEEERFQSMNGYRECTVASNWYNIDFW